MNSHDSSKPRIGRCEKASNDGVSSGSSADSVSLSMSFDEDAFAFEDAAAAAATPLGFNTSNSVTVFLGGVVGGIAFLMGLGSGAGGTY